MIFFLMGLIVGIVIGVIAAVAVLMLLERASP